MGTRSSNALIVRKRHAVPAAVKPFFEVAHYVHHADAHLWIWETNIAPIHGRQGVRDLEEEVAILGWMLSLPETDYRFWRCGSDLGERGFWDEHPFKDCPPEALQAVLKEYEKEESEIMAVVTAETPSEHAKSVLVAVCTQLVEGVKGAVVALDRPLSIQRHYADSFWGVTVRGDLSVQLSGYAAELGGQIGSLEELPLADLAQLLETAQRRLEEGPR